MIKDNRIFRSFPFHPYLFGLYPALFFLSHNISNVDITQVWRTIIALIVLVSGIWLFFKLWTRSLERSALITSLILSLLLSFGNISEMLFGKSVTFIPPNETAILALIVYMGSLILCVWFIWRVIRQVGKLNDFLNIVSLIVLFFPLLTLVNFLLTTKPSLNFQRYSVEVKEPIGGREKRPDIYYIILDGYGRSDFLKKYYGIDNSEFLDFLETNDFYIAESSLSNYNQTAQSLSSSLNFEYLDKIIIERGRNSNNRRPLARLIRENRLVDFIKSKGYTFITFQSGYWITEIVDADVYVNTSVSSLNSFEKGFFFNTIAKLWLDKSVLDSHRKQLQNSIDKLGRVNEIGTDTPRFIFVHILLPHPPFAFGPNGEPVLAAGYLQEGDGFKGTPKEYIEGYRDQLTYLNTNMINIVANILENSKTDPIIIIQGDHGPDAYLRWEPENHICFQERMGILNAYHLPGEAKKQLYPSITPVNTFRLILNKYFDEEYPFLEDRIYFSNWLSPYLFVDITPMADQCGEIVLVKPTE